MQKWMPGMNKESVNLTNGLELYITRNPLWFYGQAKCKMQDKKYRGIITNQ